MKLELEIKPRAWCGKVKTYVASKLPAKKNSTLRERLNVKYVKVRMKLAKN
jgi:hypothetical protein